MKTKEQEDAVLAEAKQILIGRLRKPGGIIDDIQNIHQFLIGEYALLDTEQFGCMFLDVNCSLINHVVMFKGSIGHCSVYPREIAREALLQNASFVILVHNHPAFSLNPSKSDIAMTLTIQNSLAALDVVLFDHIIVAGNAVSSMRAKGFLK